MTQINVPATRWHECCKWQQQQHTCGVMAINGAREIREIEVAVEWSESPGREIM
jgi:hypothetical protein